MADEMSYVVKMHYPDCNVRWDNLILQSMLRVCDSNYFLLCDLDLIVGQLPSDLNENEGTIIIHRSSLLSLVERPIQIIEGNVRSEDSHTHRISDDPLVDIEFFDTTWFTAKFKESSIYSRWLKDIAKTSMLDIDTDR